MSLRRRSSPRSTIRSLALGRASTIRSLARGRASTHSLLPAMALALAMGCGGDKKAELPPGEPSAKAPETPEPKQAEPAPAATSAKRGLVLALSRFAGTTPQPARAEL